QIVDDVLHAAGRVDHDRHVEPDLAQAADVLAERAAERPPEPAASASEPDPARAGAGSGEPRAEIGAGADRLHRTGELDHRRRARRRLRLRGLRDDDVLRLARREQRRQVLLVTLLRTHEVGNVLEREDLAPRLLARPDPVAGADAESRTDADPEAATDAR